MCSVSEVLLVALTCAVSLGFDAATALNFTLCTLPHHTVTTDTAQTPLLRLERPWHILIFSVSTRRENLPASPDR